MEVGLVKNYFDTTTIEYCVHHMQIYMNNKQYNITTLKGTLVTAGQLNAETSVNRERHCDGQ